MSTIKYQNPNDANVSATLDSAVSYPGSDSTVAAGPVEVRREIVTAGDSAGTNAMSTLVDIQQRMLCELVEIRYALGKLIGEHLEPGLHAKDTTSVGTIV